MITIQEKRIVLFVPEQKILIFSCSLNAAQGLGHFLLLFYVFIVQTDDMSGLLFLEFSGNGFSQSFYPKFGMWHCF